MSVYDKYVLEKLKELSDEYGWDTQRQLHIALQYIIDRDCSSDFSDYLEYEREAEIRNRK